MSFGGSPVWVETERIPPGEEHLLGQFYDVDLQRMMEFRAPVLHREEKTQVHWAMSEDELRQMLKRLQ